jgi:hypothetical protein
MESTPLTMPHRYNTRSRAKLNMNPQPQSTPSLLTTYQEPIDEIESRQIDDKHIILPTQVEAPLEVKPEEPLEVKPEEPSNESVLSNPVVAAIIEEKCPKNTTRMFNHSMIQSTDKILEAAQKASYSSSYLTMLASVTNVFEAVLEKPSMVQLNASFRKTTEGKIVEFRAIIKDKLEKYENDRKLLEQIKQLSTQLSSELENQLIPALLNIPCEIQNYKNQFDVMMTRMNEVEKIIQSSTMNLPFPSESEWEVFP